MRVVAGRYKGRQLRAPRSRSTRPTADRVREAVFSILGDIGSARVLDLFAGSGALGIEALSRGAGEVVFVERERAPLRAIEANLQQIVRSDPMIDQRLVRVRAGDARKVLEREIRAVEEGGAGFDLVFVDPPYRSAADLGRWLGESLPRVMPGGGRVVVECDRRAPLVIGFEAQNSLPEPSEHVYGDTLVRIVRLPAGESGDQR